MEMNSVQPEGNEPESQGADSQISDPSLYPNLESVPADYRQHIDPILKELQTNVGKKFEEHANYRKQWEPYEELGLNDYDPESIQALLQLGEIMSDQDQFKDWWSQVGNELGFMPEDEYDEDDEDYEDDEYEDSNDELSSDGIQEIINEQLQQALAPLYQDRQQQEFDQGVEQIGQELDKQMAELRDNFEAETGQELKPEIEQHIWKTALAYEEEGPQAIQKAWDEVMGIVGDAKSELFAAADNQPAKPEGPGRANTSPEPITSFDDASAVAKERIKSGNY